MPAFRVDLASEILNARHSPTALVRAVGTSPRGGIARVFLGSRGSKIMRHSPVLVLPG